MAVGTQSDFVVYDDEFFEGAYETIQQNVDAFNGASNGCIQLIPDVHRGDWRKRSFFQVVSGGLIARRDPTSVSAVTSGKMTQDDAAEPKLSRRIGPIEQTLSAWKKIGSDEAEFSYILGQQAGPEMFQNHLNTALMAIESALDGVAALENDDSGATILTSGLIDTKFLLGDKAGRIGLWVMHSKVYADLVKEQAALKITDVSNVNIYQGVPITLGIPVLVTDSSSLIISGTANQYITLGLVPGAVTVRESEQKTLVSELVTGYENLTYRIQGEYAITVGVMGFDFTGSANPNDAAIGSSANWSQVATSTKDCGGVRMLTL